MDTIVFSCTLNNGLEVSVWWITDDAVFFIEVVDPNNPDDDKHDLYTKEAKGVLSYLSELQHYR